MVPDAFDEIEDLCVVGLSMVVLDFPVSVYQSFPDQCWTGAKCPANKLRIDNPCVLLPMVSVVVRFAVIAGFHCSVLFVPTAEGSQEMTLLRNGKSTNFMIKKPPTKTATIQI